MSFSYNLTLCVNRTQSCQRHMEISLNLSRAGLLFGSSKDGNLDNSKEINTELAITERLKPYANEFAGFISELIILFKEDNSVEVQFSEDVSQQVSDNLHQRLTQLFPPPYSQYKSLS